MEHLQPETLIATLETTYSQLRESNPDRDEHWLLANTWLTRYASSEQTKRKGIAWTKFVAYKDTLQFSVLETPKSIRGLALFLVYKELGEEQAISYGIEFSQLMEAVMKSRENHTFLDEYKKRNPRTWGENQAEDHSSYSLYSLFSGLLFEQEHPEEAKEALKKSKLLQNQDYTKIKLGLN